MTLTRPLEDRFWEKVDVGDWMDCWLWTAGTTEHGYGWFALSQGRADRAHRVSYRLIVGPIPGGMELDHTCHTFDTACLDGSTCTHRRCVNPLHLEPVTRRENMLRSHTSLKAAAATHCINGHKYVETSPDAGRVRCSVCIAAVRKRMRERSRVARLLLPEFFDVVAHGTRRAYDFWGCRCPACVAAVAVPRQATRARKRAAHAPGSGPAFPQDADAIQTTHTTKQPAFLVAAV